jgi:predicted PurR-regulated permease PerM
MTPTRLPWPILFQLVAVAVGVWLLTITWAVWLLAFTALVVAAAILPAARLGERYRVPRGITVVAVYLVLAGVLALMGRLLWPALSEQWQQFVTQLPRLLDNVRVWLGDLDIFLGQWGASLPSPKSGNVEGVVGALVENTLRVTAGVVGAVIGLLAVLVIAAYIVVDAEALGRGLLELLPPTQRPVAARLGEPVMRRIGSYVRGQIVVSLFVGAILAIGLSLLGVKYALLIGALAAVLNVVPFVGSWIAALLGILSALNQSLTLTVGTALLFWGTNVFEGKVLVPQLVGRATGLHPLAVLLALFIGAHLAGLIGALVAVPFVAAVWEIVRTLYVTPRRS